jgi:UDP-N-acetylmuramate dehydrogenase
MIFQKPKSKFLQVGLLNKLDLKENGDAESIKSSFGLVNYGNATGQEILNVSKDIQETVFKMFGIHIEAEVNVI